MMQDDNGIVLGNAWKRVIGAGNELNVDMEAYSVS